MKGKNSRIEDSRDFFEKKFKTKILLEDFEKRIFEASKLLDEAIELVESMESIASKRKAFYFLHRTRRLKLLLDDLKEKKGYEKKEFDFSYKILEKIEENESTDFLDTYLRGSLEKISQNLQPDTSAVRPSGNQPYLQRKKFFTFTFRGVHFLAEKKSQKIIRNVNPTKHHVRIGTKRYPIYPGPHFGIAPSMDSIQDPTHLCILRWESNSHLEKEYRCFFFHKMDKEIQFDETTVKSRMKPLEEGMSPYIKNYFRYAGRNYYIIETD